MTTGERRIPVFLWVLRVVAPKRKMSSLLFPSTWTDLVAQFGG